MRYDFIHVGKMRDSTHETTLKQKGMKSMYFNKLKRAAAIILAGTMVVSMAGCGKKDKESQKNNDQEEMTTESQSSSTAKQDNPDYAEDDVELPEDFGNMIYPIEALMVESLSKELPYYTDESEEGEEDSFWFSMAVLSSLTDAYVKDYSVDSDDQYRYFEEETVNMYAASMYDAYAKGNLEFPELSEDDTYATYDEEKETYGFIKGDVGTLEPYITLCDKDGDDYILMTELRDDTGTVQGTYQVVIGNSSYEGEENAFAYSVKDFQIMEKHDDFEEDTEEMEENTEMTEEEVETTEVTSDNTDDGDSDAEIESISQDDALEMAQEYYGSDAEYSYQGTVTVGDYEYYDFSVEGEDISSTDVLVSTSGNDVIGGVKNDDGSWSFDQ